MTKTGPQKNEPQKGSSYGAKDIMVLEGLDPVRKRPGMYIGSTGIDGLHHLVWEVADNCIDEAMAGYAKNITIELLPDNMVAVTDDGRGIPVEVHSQTKKSTLETVLTVLHAGGKFGGGGYKVSGGLHGVGVSVVNALSDYLKAEVERDGGMFVQEYKRGVPQGKVKRVGNSDRTGTKITFQPDGTILQALEVNAKTIMEHMRQQAYLTKRHPREFHRPPQGNSGALRILFRRRTVVLREASVPRPESSAPTKFSTCIRMLGEHERGGRVSLFGQFRYERTLLREQHFQSGRRHAFYRIPLRAHPHAEYLRPRGRLL
jgi:hypothetical protein